MLENLTHREREIFDLLLEGVPPNEITEKLYISHHTVAFHRTKLYDKLGVHSIQELLTKYSTNGKTPPSKSGTGVIIPAPDLGFFSWSDVVEGWNSTC